MRRKSNKYKAQSVYYHSGLRRVICTSELDQFVKPHYSLKAQNIIYFASRYEYKVFDQLVKLFGFNNVICQHPVTLYPPGNCCPNGREWAIDFFVKTDKPMFIEAKGALTERFLDSLIALEVFNPEVFNSLYLVFDRTIPTNNRIVSSLIKAKSGCQIMLLDDFAKIQSRQLRSKKVAQ